VLLLNSVFNCSLHAQNADSVIQWDITNFHTFNTELPSNFVRALVTSDDGALWVGTEGGGLARFTEGEWTIFNESQGELPNDIITALATSDDGALWVGTYGGGLVRFAGGEWTTFGATPGELPHNIISALTPSDDGALWVGTYGGGLARFAGGEWTTFDPAQGQIPNYYVDSLTSSSDGALWVGTRRGEITRFAEGEWTTTAAVQRGLPIENISALTASDDGSVWVGTVHGLHRFAEGEWTNFNSFQGELPHDVVLSLTIGDDGALWVGTMGGLTRFSKGEWTTFNAAQGELPDDFVLSVAASDNGALWIGTRSGLTRFAEAVQTTYNTAQGGLPQDSVLSLTTSEEDVLWVGTYGGGLARFAEGEWTTFNESQGELPNDIITALATSNDGTLWVGTGGGLVRFTGDDWTTYNAAQGDLPDDIVRALVVNDNGALWVGTVGGLARFEGSEWTTFNSAQGELPEDTVEVLITGDEGTLWVGTRGGGLARFAAGEWSTYNVAKGELPDDFVLSLTIGDDGALWVGTMGGLTRFSEGEWTTFNATQGQLPDDRVTALTMSEYGALWVGTGGGLVRFAEDEWETFSLAQAEVYVESIQALTVSDDGGVWVGTGGGLIRYQDSSMRPKIVRLIGGMPNFIHTQEQHTFAVVAFDPNFRTQAQEFRYLWTLQKGQQTVETVENRNSYYSVNDLTNGNYSLRISALDINGIVSEPHEYLFTVELPVESPLVDIVKSWMSKFLVGSSITGALYLLALFPVLLIYPHKAWARTIVSSGAITKFPVLHKLILGSVWSRRRLFNNFVRNTKNGVVMPNPYIPQLICFNGEILEDGGTVGSDHSLHCRLTNESRYAHLVGRSGTGESVFLQHIVDLSADAFLQGKDELVPIYIDLRVFPLIGHSIEEVICESMASGNVELPQEMKLFLISRGGFLILVDSLNEVQSKNVNEAFQSFLNRNAENKVIFASQNDVFKRNDLPVFQLSEVSDEQAETFLREFTGWDSAWSNLPPTAKILAKNPQDLTLIAEVARALGSASKVPAQRAALYREILLRDTPMQDWAKIDAVQIRCIYAIVFRMFTEKRTLNEEVIGKWVREEIEIETGDPADDGMIEECTKALQTSRLFRLEFEINELGGRSPVISYRHELIGKFLSARHIIRLLRKGDDKENAALLAEFNSETWFDVMGFIVDELDSKKELTRFVEQLIGLGSKMTIRAAGYALGRKPELVDQQTKESYVSKRISEDAFGLVVAAG